VLAHFLFFRLLNHTHLLYYELHYGAHIERVRLINLSAYVLNRVLLPQVNICLSNQHQWKTDLVHYRIDVILNQHSSCTELEADLDSFQGGAQRLGAHKVRSLRQDDG
jgi:hypothetical protein